MFLTRRPSPRELEEFMAVSNFLKHAELVGRAPLRALESLEVPEGGTPPQAALPPGVEKPLEQQAVQIRHEAAAGDGKT